MKRTTAIALEETLLFLYYCADNFMLPTLQKWDQSYEGWLTRNGLLKRVRYLEAQKLVGRQRADTGWVWKLTDLGCQRVGGGNDPQAWWKREWDGRWRQIIFDLPLAEHRARSSLVRWLRANRFGYLQDSVWITPHPVDQLTEALQRHRADAASFIILESQCARGFTNENLVQGAWPFGSINQAYRDYQQFADTHLRLSRGARPHPQAVFAILRLERVTWRKAFVPDPLLPEPLWPRGYTGAVAWQLRQQLLRQFIRHALP